MLDGRGRMLDGWTNLNDRTNVQEDRGCWRFVDTGVERTYKDDRTTYKDGETKRGQTDIDLDLDKQIIYKD